MSTLTSTTCTLQFTAGERDKIDIRSSAVLGQEICAVEAGAGLHVNEIWAKTGCEGTLDEEDVLVSDGGGGHLSV